MEKRFRSTVQILTLVMAAVLFGAEARAGYPLATIQNNTDYSVRGKVEYASAFCKNDSYSVDPGQTWEARSRGMCLITGITGNISEGSKYRESTRVTPYDSTGTSYSQFQISAYGGQYRIFSRQEFKRVSRTGQGKSPGFYFVNKTEWPIAYSLEQAGCLYHDVVPRRWNGRDGVRRVDTGAVWFTLRMHIQPDGINPQSDWDCVEPVAEIVGDVLFAVMSGGTGAALAGPKFVTKQVAKTVIKKAIKASVKSVARTTKEKVGEYLRDAGSITMGGQYAGYEWPFRCHRMPEYHITGGPGLQKDENGEIYITPGPALTVTKVNGCGNDMMLASPKQTSAPADVPFPELDFNESNSAPSSQWVDACPAGPKPPRLTTWLERNGVEHRSHCFYLANGRESCTDACRRLGRIGRCDVAGMMMAAQSTDACRSVVDALGRRGGLEYTGHGRYRANDSGCTYGDWGSPEGRLVQVMELSRTGPTCGAVDPDVHRMRVCACE